MNVNLTQSVFVPNAERIMYARNLNFYRGVDNTVKFSFKNNDQKKVPIHDKTITFNMLDKASHQTLISRTMTIEDGNNGIAKLVVTCSDLEDIKAQFYTWSVKVVDGEDVEHIGYQDDSYGASGECVVKEGVYPEFYESLTSGFHGGNTSSIFNAKPRLNNNNALHTAQFYFSNAYTGSVTVQGTMDDVANATSINWFDIKTVNYSGETSPAYTTWNGIFSGIRFVKSDTTATVSSLLYRY